MGLTQNLGRLSPSIFSDASLNIGVGAAPSGSYKFEVTGTSKVSGVLTLGSTLSNGTYTYTLPAATGTLALVGGAGVGTVTSVAALTIGTTGTDLSSSVATGTTTPVITLNVPTASAANRGALSSADWSTFNSKQGTITLTTTGTSGAATFTSNTLNIPDYGSALSGYLPLTGGTLTGPLSGTSASFSSTLLATGVGSNTVLSGTGLKVTSSNANLYLNFSPSFTGGVEGEISSSDNGLRIVAASTSSSPNSLRFLTSNASGVSTLALTLSGTQTATFTGALSGTSATFSGTINANSANSQIRIGGATTDAFIGVSTSTLYLTDWATATKGLTINLSTGAATFSSTINSGIITATSLVSNGQVSLYDYVNVQNNYPNFTQLSGIRGRAYYQTNYPTSILMGDPTAANVNIITFNVSDTDVTGTEKMRITSAGISVTGAATFSSSVSATSFNGNSNGYPYNTYLYGAADASTINIQSGSTAGYAVSIDLAGGNATNPNTIIFKTASAERMRITSGGDIYAYASAYFTSTGAAPSATLSGVAIQNPRLVGPTLFSSGNVSDSRSFIQFINANGVVGSISTSGTATAFNTSSDYRLKQDLKDYNGLELISAIKTYDYEWKSDKTRTYGVLAHELQEVIPQAVFGEKDAEEMQGVDYSKIVPILVKAIQELTQKVNTLNN